MLLDWDRVTKNEVKSQRKNISKTKKNNNNVIGNWTT